MAVFTLWIVFSGWLLLSHLRAPRFLTTALATLGWLELLAVLTWGFGSESCTRRPCSAVAETARTAASVDLPALAGVVLALALAHAVRGRRSGAKIQA